MPLKAVFHLLAGPSLQKKMMIVIWNWNWNTRIRCESQVRWLLLLLWRGNHYRECVEASELFSNILWSRELAAFTSCETCHWKSGERLKWWMFAGHESEHLQCLQYVFDNRSLFLSFSTSCKTRQSGIICGKVWKVLKVVSCIMMFADHMKVSLITGHKSRLTSPFHLLTSYTLVFQ